MNKLTKKIKERQYVKVFIQIVLLITLNVAVSYLIHQQDVKIISAQDDDVSITDLELGDLVATCILSKEGELCQEFGAGECEDLCEGDCLYTTIDTVPECELGTCYDADEGFCFPNSPKFACLDDGGQWFSKSQGVPSQCEIGCCVSYNKADMTTERECNKIEEVLGFQTEFKPELNELECYFSFTERVKGACVFGSGEDRTCRFVSKLQCYSENGVFYPSFLCSHPSLESGCEKQQTTGCVPGKDGVYWFDGCYNQENIYEGNDAGSKASSWNEGRVKSKENSCSLEGINGPLSNQDTCGNCDRLRTSSICSAKTAEESLDFGDVVCRDISCTDSEGNRKEHGEKWCDYQGQVGYDEDLDRGGATPGSRHFLVECVNGQIIKEPCQSADYRDYICTQYNEEKIDGSGNISRALCRQNNADVCLIYNTLDDIDDGLELCEDHPDCYVKNVKVPSSNFNFKACVPKYPKGFDLSTPEGIAQADTVCGIGTLECASAKVKEYHYAGGTSWTWKNKGCTKEAFTKELNDFCMSLGDCGGSVNYVGEYSENYEITGAPELNDDYKEDLEVYAEDDEDEFIQAIFFNPADFAPDEDTLADYLNFDEGGTYSNSFPDNPAEGSIFIRGSATWGVMGLTTFLSSFSGAGWTYYGAGDTWMLNGAGFTTAFAMAVLAASLMGQLLSDLEILGGITSTLAYTLVGIAGISAFQLTSSIINPGFGAAGWVSLGVLVGVYVFTLYLDYWGVGEVKEYTTTFTCHAWEAPTVDSNEDCQRCYDAESDEGCSKYACESIGRSCKFLNEGTIFEECAYVPGPDGPPIITPLEGVLPDGYTYENVSNDGYKIESGLANGCIPSSSLLVFGLHLNEPGRCTYTVMDNLFTGDDVVGFLNSSEYNPEDFEPDFQFLGTVDGWSDDSVINDALPEGDSGFSDYQGMTEFYFGGHSMDMTNITHAILIPNLEQLGIPGFDPNAIGDFSMNVFCEDTEGTVRPAAYKINFCITPEDRTTPPVVLAHKPRDGLVKANATDEELRVYMSYTSNCKWDLSNREYDEMENDFWCETNPDKFVPVLTYGGEGAAAFECITEVDMSDVASQEEKEIFVRCKDTQGNTMTHSHEITLEKTPPLEITSMTPKDGEVKIFGDSIVLIYTEVLTAGGNENGIAQCQYWSGTRFNDFAHTFDVKHWQENTQETPGDKTLYVLCVDTVGNVVEDTSSFTILYDDTAPEVIRVYKYLDSLRIVTDEDAACYYSHNNCNYEFDDATEDETIHSMTTAGYSKQHNAPWISGKTYYIRCEDKFSNYESGCSKIVRAG